jgi:signal transduction histidine kinase
MDGCGKLSVRTARDGDRVLVEIGANGPGIPRAAAHVLEPFSTTKPEDRRFTPSFWHPRIGATCKDAG